MLDGRGVPPNKYLSLRERVAVLLAEDIEVYIDDWYSKDVKDGWIHDVVYGYVGSLNKYEIANRCLEVIEESQNIKLPS
jgi:hypothetical protein